jgi:hypothetical protein
MINNVRNTVLDLIKKANNGYITPDEFNRLAHQAQLEIFTELMTEYTEALAKFNNGLSGQDYADILGRIEEDIERFLVEPTALAFSGGKFALPTNLYKVGKIIYNNTTTVDKVPYAKINLLSATYLTEPSVDFPMYCQYGSDIKVFPTTINSSIECIYHRYPLQPKWTYIVAPGSSAPLFNITAVDYQDFELPASYENKLVVRILQYCGILIRESEVASMAKGEEVQTKQEE